MAKTCKNCGCQFEPLHKMGKPPVFCTDPDCVASRHEKKLAKLRLPNPNKICKFCGCVFTPKRKASGRKRDYCFDPECVKKQRKTELTIITPELYEKRRSYRSRRKAKTKKEKRLCQAKLKNCHVYIDNANKRACSACHSQQYDWEDAWNYQGPIPLSRGRTLFPFRKVIKST